MVEILTQLQLGAFKQPIKSKFYFYGFQLTYIQKSRCTRKECGVRIVNIREKDEMSTCCMKIYLKNKDTTDGLASLHYMLVICGL